jgi:plastocyanin
MLMKNKISQTLFAALTLLASSSLGAVTNTVQIGNFFFNPTNLTINVGDVVRWTNTTAATVTHDVTRTNLPFAWASGDLTAANRTYQLTFSAAGSYPYFCNRHVYAGMPANRHPEQTGTVAVVAANLPPSVALTNPANNASFCAPTNLLLQVSAADDGTVTNVQFFNGATLLGNDTTSPFSLTLNSAAAANYAFTARAQDNTGLANTSAVINVFVLTNAFLTAPARLPDGKFRFTVQGISGQTYAAESSTNLTVWSPFATNVAPANTFNITDSTSTNILQRYYRTRQNY